MVIAGIRGVNTGPSPQANLLLARNPKWFPFLFRAQITWKTMFQYKIKTIRCPRMEWGTFNVFVNVYNTLHVLARRARFVTKHAVAVKHIFFSRIVFDV